MTASSIDSTAAAEHFFAGAIAAGLTHVVVSPGSRSTPLAVAADRAPGLAVHVHLDERSAAFAALGQAKAAATVVALVCTSGTAAANYLPAVSEASLSNVGLVVITSDRPPEHQHIGVGQSFDQRGLYGPHVRHEVTMPVGGDGGAAFTERAGWRAVATATERHGPVHVNWAFRLPLEPTLPPLDAASALGPVAAPLRLPEPAQVASLEASLTRASRPLIIAGPDAVDSRTPVGAEALGDAATTLGIPILADVLSGVRGTAAPTLVDAPSLAIEASPPTPDLIIRLGQTPTAKAIRLWWETLDVPHVMVDPYDDWHDPSSLMTSRLRCAPAALLEEVASTVNATTVSRTGWVDEWLQTGQRAEQASSETLAAWGSLTEAHVAAIVGRHTPANTPIFASSSMPVRDLDSFCTARRSGRVLANRGINGIDGVVSTSIGVVRSSPANRVVVYIGDVAALHDVGGILDAARQGVDMTIVIPNNDGGGIFSFLPAKSALDDSQFSSLFHTPHGTTFDFLGHHPGIRHEAITSGEAAHLGVAMERSFSEPGISIIEVPVSTTDRLEFRDALATRLHAS